MGTLRKHATLVLFSTFLPGHFVLICDRRLASLWGMEHRVERRVDSLVDQKTPTRAAGRPVSDLNQIARLVLDRVLEMESEQGHGFVSGPQAWRVMFDEQPLPVADDAVTHLSYAALRFADEGYTDTADIAAELYDYNFAPSSPIWRQRLPTTAATDFYLGTEALLRRPSVAAAWHRETPVAGFSYWTGRQHTKRRRPHHRRFKLYLSPDIECTPQCLAKALPVMTDHRVRAFKIGSDLFGLLRPDKIVLYLESRSHLAALAADLVSELAEMRASGVPFTAAIDPGGLVSWGIDPARDNLAEEGASWRGGLCQRLAIALATARQGRDTALDAPEFAARRIALEGVDPVDWRPLEDFGLADGGENEP